VNDPHQHPAAPRLTPSQVLRDLSLDLPSLDWGQLWARRFLRYYHQLPLRLLPRLLLRLLRSLRSLPNLYIVIGTLHIVNTITGTGIAKPQVGDCQSTRTFIAPFTVSFVILFVVSVVQLIIPFLVASQLLLYTPGETVEHSA
jgi:hypothetical protein